MKCKEVPVMAILKEFRAMNDGVRGRKGHRAADAPEYLKSTSMRSAASRWTSDS
jgi:hypothetical protein